MYLRCFGVCVVFLFFPQIKPVHWEIKSIHKIGNILMSLLSTEEYHFVLSPKKNENVWAELHKM